MKRTLFIVAILVAFATGASAATLSVVSNKTTYSIGETITLTVTGDAQGVTAYTIYGRLFYDESLVDAGTRSQVQVGPGWSKGSLETGPGFSEAFDQLILTAAGATPGNNLLSTVTLIASALGTVNVTWDTAPGTLQLNFFGLSNAPGTSFQIVPEPTTVALLGLGLLGLALSGRRRS